MVFGFFRKKNNKKTSDIPSDDINLVAQMLALYAGAEDKIDVDNLVNDLLKKNDIDNLSNDLFKNKKI